MRKCVLSLLAIAVVGGASLVRADDPNTYDPRFGVVATDSSGWDGLVHPMQGPAYFDALRTAWWYNYTPSLQSAEYPGLTLNWAGCPRLYMFWSAGGDTPAAIQAYAAAAKAANPGQTIWWAMSNEVNDTAQANQPAAGFAAIYLKYHQNLRLGDPTCKTMGPGLLNWTYTGGSTYQTGRNWYLAFRAAWAADPNCVAYSQIINGTNYPPQDAFCMHTYDLRRVNAASWTYCRDEMIACHADLLTYPETTGLKLWNTEFCGLLAPKAVQAADFNSGLILWMRDQPWIERWFLFYTHSDRFSSWPIVELFDANGDPTQLALAERDLAALPTGARFWHYSYNAPYGQATPYVRPGWTQTTSIREYVDAPGYELALGATSYPANAMRGRTFTVPHGRIYKVRFNYYKSFDSSAFTLVLDTPAQPGRWQMTTPGTVTGYAEVDLSDDPAESVSFAVCSNGSVTATGIAYVFLANVMLLTIDDVDLNADGAVNAADAELMLQSLSGPAAAPPMGGERADQDHDGDADVRDLAAFQLGYW
jgi:hypothetical protein